MVQQVLGYLTRLGRFFASKEEADLNEAELNLIDALHGKIGPWPTSAEAYLEQIAVLAPEIRSYLNALDHEAARLEEDKQPEVEADDFSGLDRLTQGVFGDDVTLDGLATLIEEIDETDERAVNALHKGVFPNHPSPVVLTSEDPLEDFPELKPDDSSDAENPDDPLTFSDFLDPEDESDV